MTSLKLSSRTSVLIWLLVALTSSLPADLCGADYAVSFLQNTVLEDIRKGAPPQHVRVYNSKLNTITPVDEPFKDDIDVQWCDESALGPPHSRGYALPIDLYSNPQIESLLDGIRGNHEVEVWHRRNSCFPAKGLLGLTCRTQFKGPRDYDLDSTIHLYCIYDKTDSSLIYVDREMKSSSRYWKPYDRGFFDSNGDYFYYSLDGLAKRFSIRDKTIDTIPGGDVPIVPWNRDGLAVYSSKDNAFRLLNSDWEVVGEIKAKFPGLLMLSCYAIDEATDVIVVSYERISFPASLYSDGPHMMAIYVLDFEEGTISKLVDDLSKGQIMSASRIE